MAMNFADEIFLSYSAWFLNMPQNLMTWGRRPSEESLGWIQNCKLLKAMQESLSLGCNVPSKSECVTISRYLKPLDNVN
jgi:hypothetical protein